MNIGIVFPRIYRSIGGGPKVVYEYANYLAKKGHRITIYYMTDDFLIKYPVLHFLPMFAKQFAAKFWVQWQPRWMVFEKGIKKRILYKAREMGRHDIVMATANSTADTVNALPSECGKKAYFIQDLENWHISDEKLFETYAMGMHNITVAKWLSEIVDKHSKIPSICISNGIDGKIFYVKNPVKNRPKHSVVFHYRSAAYKGAKYAFETIEILRKRYSDLVVTIVSSEKKPEVIPDYCNYVYKARPEEVADINNNSAVFLCSSVQEGFGLPGLEAMGCGCALVSSAYQGVLEYAEDGVNALLSPVRDSQAMADNVIRLFEDEKLLETIVNNGLITARERDCSAAAEKLEKLFYSIMQSE